MDTMEKENLDYEQVSLELEEDEAAMSSQEEIEELSAGIEDLAGVLEAILFTLGEAVEVSRLAQALEVKEREIRRQLEQLQEQYRDAGRGISLIWLEDSVQLCTKPEMYEYLIRIAKTPRKLTLTETVLETLSIIAYKQPVTRAEIERIRGVSCDHAINRLLEYDLICELGRLDAPGRPLLFGTTEQFLRCFGVKNIEELPKINPVQVEEFKLQAEAEVQLQLDI